MYEMFEDTKGVIKSSTSKKDRQYNGQKRNDKGQTMICKTLHRRLKIVLIVSIITKADKN